MGGVATAQVENFRWFSFSCESGGKRVVRRGGHGKVD